MSIRMVDSRVRFHLLDAQLVSQGGNLDDDDEEDDDDDGDLLSRQ